jgi:hypothetical protein
MMLKDEPVCGCLRSRSGNQFADAEGGTCLLMQEEETTLRFLKRNQLAGAEEESASGC